MLILRTIARHHLSDLHTHYPVASCFPSLFVILLLIASYDSNARLYAPLPSSIGLYCPVYSRPLHPTNITT
jgi:hypothetical protein